MNNPDHDFYMAIRAAYIQSAKAKEKQIIALQQDRAAALDIVSQIEKKLEIKQNIKQEQIMSTENTTFTNPPIQPLQKT